ncbi:MAG: tRNA (guanosine(46)-N7)-methyltransferase TrmB [Planctomycetia bacterium]|nr:tRNA (guanosine(46)-N7)-methyltransferase TrmB [Planctomycetia bacterium]
MARRALRKLNPQLDLSKHLYTLEQLTPPLSGAALFGRDAPWEVEMGSGKGLFISHAATSAPERNFLGVEVAKKYAAHCAAQLVKAGAANAAMISGDGLRLFREFLPTAGIAAVHVYFPDPWWKARHKKRRVVNEAFLVDVQRVLVPGGSLHFWTDVEEYYLSSLELIAQTALIGPLPVQEKLAEHELDYRTHFERRTRRNELPVYRSEFRKAE